MKKDGFIFDWTKKLGFRKNPFETDLPGSADEFFVGYEEEKRKANLFILENYQFGVILGEDGSGKTLFLKWILEQLSAHKDKIKVAYINASELGKERDLIEGLLSPLLSTYEKTFSKPHKKIRLEEIGKYIHSKLKNGRRLLILLDDAGSLPKRYVALFKYFFTNNMNIQLIVAGVKQDLMSKGLKEVHSKDSLRIELNKLSFEETLEMIEKRVVHFGQEGIFPFEEDMIKKIHKKEDGNPRKILKACREEAIKLSLDKNYMKKEFDKLEEIRRERKEEQGEESSGGLFTIKIGKDDENSEGFEIVKKEKSDKLSLPAPDFLEQQDILSDLVNKNPELAAEEPEEKEEEHIQEFVEIEQPEEEVQVVEEKEETEIVEEENDKEREELSDADELLSQLAKEFDKD